MNIPPESDVEFLTRHYPQFLLTLVLDNSAAMLGDSVVNLEAAINAFCMRINHDYSVSQILRIAVVTFGTQVTVVKSFRDVDSTPFFLSHIGGMGGDLMIDAVHRSLDLVDAEVKNLRVNAIQIFRPWIFLVSTAGTFQSRESLELLSRRIADGEYQQQLAFFPIAAPQSDTTDLSFLSVRQPVKLKNLDFVPMFEWLESSLHLVVEAGIGNQVRLPSLNWAEFEKP